MCGMASRTSRPPAVRTYSKAEPSRASTVSHIGGSERSEPNAGFGLRSILLGEYTLPAGLDFQFLTVGTFISAIRAFLEPPEQATCMHLPAPVGLPGGYPVVVQDAAVRLDLPATWQKKTKPSR